MISIDAKVLSPLHRWAYGQVEQERIRMRIPHIIVARAGWALEGMHMRRWPPA